MFELCFRMEQVRIETAGWNVDFIPQSYTEGKRATKNNDPWILERDTDSLLDFLLWGTCNRPAAVSQLGVVETEAVRCALVTIAYSE